MLLLLVLQGAVEQVQVLNYSHIRGDGIRTAEPVVAVVEQPLRVAVTVQRVAGEQKLWQTCNKQNKET